MTIQTLLNLFATVSLLLERRFYSSRGEFSRAKGLNWMIKLDVLSNFGLIMSDLALVRVKLHLANCMLFYLTSVTPWCDSDDSFTVMPRILKGVAVSLLCQLYERFLVRFYWSTTTKETVAVISRSSKMTFKLPTLSLKSMSCKSSIQTRAEGEWLYIWYNTDAHVVYSLWYSYN